MLCNPKQKAVGIKFGSFTRDMTAASGDAVITGVGFQPRLVIFMAALTSNTSTFSVSIDSANGSSGSGVGSIFTRGSASFLAGTSYSIQLETTAGTNFQSGSISAVGTDGFTVTWVKTGSPTGTANIFYAAFA